MVHLTLYQNVHSVSSNPHCEVKSTAMTRRKRVYRQTKGLSTLSTPALIAKSSIFYSQTLINKHLTLPVLWLRVAQKINAIKGRRLIDRQDNEKLSQILSSMSSSTSPGGVQVVNSRSRDWQDLLWWLLAADLRPGENDTRDA